MNKPSASKTKTLIAVGIAAVLAAAALPAQAGPQSTNLPGGTDLSVSVDTPADGATIIIPPGETEIDVPVTGGASIGEATPVADTTLIFVLDVSGSTSAGAGGASTCADADGSGIANTILDCEIEGIIAAANQAESSGTVDEYGLVKFAGGSAIADMQAAPGDQAFTGSAADVTSVASASFASGSTNFEAAVQDACTLAGSASNPNILVLFLSDGFNNVGGSIVDDLPCAPATFETFAVGAASACGDPLADDSLQRIADLTGGTCTNVVDPSTLATVVPDAIASSFDALTLESDAASVHDLTGFLTAGDFSQPGPNSVAYAFDIVGVDPGDHWVQVMANGTDGGGSGSVRDNHTFTVVQGAWFDVKPGGCPNPVNTKSKGKTPVAVLGSASFDVDLIDVASVRLEGVAPVKDAIEDVATPYTGGLSSPPSENDCHGLGADGHEDLTLKFDTPDLVAALEANHGPLTDGQIIVVEISGDYDGASFVGFDVIRLNVPPTA